MKLVTKLSYAEINVTAVTERGLTRMTYRRSGIVFPHSSRDVISIVDYDF